MKRLLFVVLILGCLSAARSFGADWPQHRYGARRGAASQQSLPAEMHLQWTRELPAPRPAFPGQIRLRYDATYSPVVLGKTIFVPSMVTDSLTAYDTETGQQRWVFFAEGPVRFAPAARDGKVYFVSDDGHLYCVAADDGKLLWKFRGLPEGRTDRKVLGNERLVSLFPARGGPVLADGVVYFGAGIWSGEGIFVHALDADSGKVVWSNTDSDHIAKANMDHSVGYFAGLSPQGYLAIVDGKLVVPCGTQLPAILDLKTGKRAPYTMGWGGRNGLPKGCVFVAGTGKYLIHGGDLYNIEEPNQERNSRGKNDMFYLGGLTRLQIDRTNQKGLGDFRKPVLTDDAMYCREGGIVAYDLTDPKIEERAKSKISNFRKNDKYPDKMVATFPELWKLPSESRVHIKAGGRLYCGKPGFVEVVAIPKEGEKPEVVWKDEIQGTPERMLAADGKLFVVTREGRLYAFGAKARSEPVTHTVPNKPAPKADKWTKKAAEILKKTKTADGYILVLGIGTGRLAEELVRQSKCDVIAVDSDAEKVEKLRENLQQAGLYGSRVAIHVGDPMSYPFPPYLASLIVSEDPAALGDVSGQALAETLFFCLRPYGGTACLELPEDKRKSLANAVSPGRCPGAEIRQEGDFALLTRRGALPDAADWSHSGVNAANTGASKDRFVKAPLERLWFDGSFRWNRQQGTTVVRIAGGRVLIQADKLYAIDVYTGRHLWQAAAPSRRGAKATMAVVSDGIYLPDGRSCVVLDPATGEKTGEVFLPDDIGGTWSNIVVADDQLVGSSGKHVVSINRRTGKLLWKHECPKTVGSVAVGGDKVFCADLVVRKRDQPEPADVKTYALNAATGKLLWEAPGAAVVRYGETHDVVVNSRGVYRAKDGNKIWSGGGGAPITADKLLGGNADGFHARDLLTGDKSGRPLKWNRRGCTRLRAGANLLTTRFQGNAAYVDLATGDITSIWNVRAACSNNLFPANGVLNIPNLSGGCTCNYIPISQAFVPKSQIKRVADR